MMEGQVTKLPVERGREYFDRDRIGVLLINLGTPAAPRTADVRRYLREFLSDPRVMDINPIGRFLLLNGLILPFRSPKSAAAYRKIWLPEGSPLLHHSARLRDALSAALGRRFRVALAMRYGNPSINEGLAALFAEGIQDLVIVPLFPHDAAATHTSATAAALAALLPNWIIPPLRVVPAFFADAGFVAASADVVTDARRDFAADHVLFSFHGLPERHVEKSDDGIVACDRKAPCPAPSHGNRFCYRAQCFETARLVAKQLDLTDYSVGFQSRLGRGKWIEPYTDALLPQLRERGIKRLLVTCPSFVADCLETLEEVGMRYKERWLALGGEAFKLTSALNSRPLWVSALANIIQRT